MFLNPYAIYHFFMFNVGGFLVKYLNAKMNCTFGKDTRFFLGGGVINETGKKENITIGKNTTIKGWLLASGKGKIKIGDYSVVQPHCIIRAAERIEIGDFCYIAGDYIEDHNSHSKDYLQRRIKLKNPHSSFKEEMPSKPIKIGNDVWVGRRVMIYKGVTIGNGAIVAAGAVVTHDVPSFSLAAGNPAKIVRYFGPTINKKVKKH